MDILFVHQGYPAQFVHLSAALSQAGARLTSISRHSRREPVGTRGSDQGRRIVYQQSRGNTKNIHFALVETETKLLRGTWVAERALQLRDEGYQPDLIIAHPGWGETLFLRDVWPQCRQLHYLEFDYGCKLDQEFDPEFQTKLTFEQQCRQRLKQTTALLCFQSMDWGYTPTQFQWNTLPAAYRSRVSVIHDGIDVERLRPNPAAKLTLSPQTVLMAGDPVLTFVNRTFEPYRGVHRLMRALPSLQQRWPDLQVLLIGRDVPKVSYGKARVDGKGWLSAMRDELDGQLDWDRIHAPGALNYSQFIAAMQISAVHVYFSYPFVLSWSLLEAMACGAMVVGSATPPVEEVIVDGDNGLLVDFHDQEGLVSAVDCILSSPEKYASMRLKARQTIKSRFALQQCLRRQLAMVESLSLGPILPESA